MVAVPVVHGMHPGALRDAAKPAWRALVAVQEQIEDVGEEQGNARRKR